MYVNKYVVNNIGTKWANGRSKKNQLLDSLDGTDGIFLKNPEQNRTSQDFYYDYFLLSTFVGL